MEEASGRQGVDLLHNEIEDQTEHRDARCVGEWVPNP
jgi:hypothetical protein